MSKLHVVPWVDNHGAHSWRLIRIGWFRITVIAQSKSADQVIDAYFRIRGIKRAEKGAA